MMLGRQVVKWIDEFWEEKEQGFKSRVMTVEDYLMVRFSIAFP